MRPFLFPLLAALLSGTSVFAQGQPAAPQSALPMAVSSTAPDTVAALHRLFASRRQRRNILAVGLGAGLVAGTAGSLATADSSPDNRRNILDLDSPPTGSGGTSAPSAGSTASTTDGWLIGAAATLPLLGLDYALHAGYTHKKEAAAVAAYQAGKLPARLKKQLRARYFQPTKPKS